MTDHIIFPDKPPRRLRRPRSPSSELPSHAILPPLSHSKDPEGTDPQTVPSNTISMVSCLKGACCRTPRPEPPFAHTPIDVRRTPYIGMPPPFPRTPNTPTEEVWTAKSIKGKEKKLQKSRTNPWTFCKPQNQSPSVVRRLTGYDVEISKVPEKSSRREWPPCIPASPMCRSHRRMTTIAGRRSIYPFSKSRVYVAWTSAIRGRWNRSDEHCRISRLW